MYKLLVIFVTYPQGGEVSATSQVLEYTSRPDANHAAKKLSETVSKLGKYEIVTLY